MNERSLVSGETNTGIGRHETDLFEGGGYLGKAGQEGADDVVHGDVLVSQLKSEGHHLGDWVRVRVVGDLSEGESGKGCE